MNTLFLTGIFTDISQVERNSKCLIDNAANTLQLGFVSGLREYLNLTVISLPFIGSFPFLYKKLFISKSDLSINNQKIEGIEFTNLILFKQISRYRRAKKAILRYIRANDIRIIIVYSLHSPFLKAVVNIRKRFPEITVCAIVPDLPTHMSDNNNLIYSLFKFFDIRIINKCLKQIDSFVLLTDQMASELKLGNKRWVRVEGIYNDGVISKESIKEKHKTILYSGNLAKRYGISDLMDAFASISDPDYRLWLCGDGDYRSEVKRRSKLDSRITFYGQLPRREVLMLQKRATVLINPRTSEGEYTKFSFPSKIIEYLSSGTPTIMHKLSGIPNEYLDYVFLTECENSKGLLKTIIKVCEMKQEELNEFGLRAAHFIMNSKSPGSQALKVYKMLTGI